MQLSINRRLLAAFAATVIAVLSWWLLTSVETEKGVKRGREQHVRDYYLKNFTLTGMGDNGEADHRLVASYLVHYADDDTAEVTQPYMTVLRPDGMPWEVRAAEGWLSVADQLLLLKGDVRIERRPGPDNSGVEIVTDELKVQLDKEYAETDRPVTIKQQQGVTEAVGMTASLREGRLQLLNQVKGIYVPENQ